VRFPLVVRTKSEQSLRDVRSDTHEMAVLSSKGKPSLPPNSNSYYGTINGSGDVIIIFNIHA
jgi:hypothetical protein